jgi:HD-GYP domain-containing protein (c-di-GMP phosphodiesterase class II)
LLESTSTWESYLDAEPSAPAMISEERLSVISLAFARYADLKSPTMLGHSPGVAELAQKAALSAGLDTPRSEELRRAALLHDLGVVSVPTGVWEKRGALDASEWERVRLHAYYTERVLSRIPALSASARIAGAHHERCDGTGYPRGERQDITARSARLLAAADTYHAMIERRPYRDAHTPQQAERRLREEVLAGRLCPRAVDCVLSAVGHASRSSPELPNGLTAREVEVLVRVARGLTSKEVALALRISTRTAQHHLEHIYEKIGVSTRAAAALFAVRNGLIVPGYDE